MKKTKENMQALQTYRPQFDSVIEAYAQTKQIYQACMRQFYQDGCKITESYTNKAGATNDRKTALYLTIETLRKDIINYENILGLTPAGIKKINDEMRAKTKVSKLDLMLEKLG